MPAVGSVANMQGIHAEEEVAALSIGTPKQNLVAPAPSRELLEAMDTKHVLAPVKRLFANDAPILSAETSECEDLQV